MEVEAVRGATEAYPVDILEDDPDGYQSDAQVYYNLLREGAPSSTEVFSLPIGEQVRLETSSLCFCTLYRDDPQHKILVLVNPQDTKTVVAVYLKESWWSTEDVLRTSDPTREGLVKVQSFGERIVLFVLNTIVFGRLERSLDDDDMFFLPHPAKEQAKILWRDGAAVGFYSIKMKGSLCGDGTSACYLLPVFDTVFVRRKNRCQGLGTAMLKDFCDTFPEDEALGVSCPVSPAMYKVLRHFLLTCPSERGRLWEVEPPGAWGQRVNIWLKVSLQEARLQDGSTVCSECSEEDTDTPRETSQDGGPTQLGHGESHKEWITRKLEKTQGDQECVPSEEESGMSLRPPWDEMEGRRAKRTVAVAELAGEPWRKCVRQTPNSSDVHLASPASKPENFMWP
ncbi:protein FAM169B isoform X1 [Meriones unguiculatus]|uniref:protein FAM169B isoform X1 n=1 Tax=Meriones unguiculatus TaxID=10047 RepID=UPI00293E6965|nr:protein FAM169B isoform X1 [Meriones unguiculatus]